MWFTNGHEETRGNSGVGTMTYYDCTMTYSHDDTQATNSTIVSTVANGWEKVFRPKSGSHTTWVANVWDLLTLRPTTKALFVREWQVPCQQYLFRSAAWILHRDSKRVSKNT